MRGERRLEREDKERTIRRARDCVPAQRCKNVTKIAFEVTCLPRVFKNEGAGYDLTLTADLKFVSQRRAAVCFGGRIHPESPRNPPWIYPRSALDPP